jgi:hypothetical protein
MNRTYRVVYKKDRSSTQWKVASKVCAFDEAKRLLKFVGSDACIYPSATFERIGTALLDGCHRIDTTERMRFRD